MKLDKKFQNAVEEKVKEYLSSIYDGVRFKRITFKKCGKESAYLFIECMCYSPINGDWKNACYLAFADTDMYIDLYSCDFESTLIFDLESEVD